MFELSIRAKSYLVIILIISCFGILYPKILHPMLLHLLGLSKSEGVQNEFLHPRERQLRSNFESQKRTQAGRVASEKQSSGRSGVVTMILPIYAVGIVFYMVYTLVKVFGSDKSKVKERKRESILKNYYRDFHYDPADGEFKMNYNAAKPEYIDEIKRQSSYRYKTPNDIYDCAKTLPHDLEILLQKVDDRNINEDEMHQLRVRLEETEAQLTRILAAMEQFDNVPAEQNQSKDIGKGQFEDNDPDIETLPRSFDRFEEQAAVHEEDSFEECIEVDGSENVVKQRKKLVS